MKEPFYITDEDHAALLSRYLIEDNEEEYVVVDPMSQASIIMV